MIVRYFADKSLKRTVQIDLREDCRNSFTEWWKNNK